MTFGIIVGTRPNFVKASAVVRALRKHGQKPVLIHTGQHHDAQLSDVFFKRLDLPRPDHHLGVASASRGEQLGEITTKLSQLLPELGLSELIVVGDVTSTVAGALAADACDLPVSHVEAGLRSFDLTMPEERNRMLVDAIAHRLFASEPSGVENLLREGHASSTIHHVGNVMIDTAAALPRRGRRGSGVEGARPRARQVCGRHLAPTRQRRLPGVARREPRVARRARPTLARALRGAPADTGAVEQLQPDVARGREASAPPRVPRVHRADDWRSPRAHRLRRRAGRDGSLARAMPDRA